ncbi:MAG TPA: hypothetical protein VM307_01590 [Egibacteraceae bacterium]|nr:hypothetical protein [Egibacteraceae bacterium]
MSTRALALRLVDGDVVCPDDGPESACAAPTFNANLPAAAPAAGDARPL